MWKPVSDLTLAECESEVEHLARYFADCRASGHGVSSKYRVRYHACLERIAIAVSSTYRAART